MNTWLLRVAQDVNCVHEIPADLVPELVGQLENLQLRLLARLFTPSTAGKSGETNVAADDRLLTIDQVAVALQFTRSYTYELVRRHQLRAVRAGKYVRVRLKDLNDWILAHRDEGVDARLVRGLGSPTLMSDRNKPKG